MTKQEYLAALFDAALEIGHKTALARFGIGAPPTPPIDLDLSIEGMEARWRDMQQCEKMGDEGLEIAADLGQRAADALEELEAAPRTFDWGAAGLDV